MLVDFFPKFGLSPIFSKYHLIPIGRKLYRDGQGAAWVVNEPKKTGARIAKLK
jgi:hypothetical protein